ncbi:MAG TPA: DMT family transporter [Patescibacteria group bacterium]
MSISKAHKAIWALIISNIIWGAASPIFKWSLQGTPLFTLAFLRFLIPLILIFIFTKKKDLAIKEKDFMKIFMLSFLGLSINIAFSFIGLTQTASINAPIIGSSGPIFIMLGSFLYLNEHPKKKVILGNMIGFLGILLIILQPLFQHTPNMAILGNFFLILATLGTVGNTIISRKVLQEYKPITITFWAFLIATITFLPPFAQELLTKGFLPHANLHAAVGIIFGAFLSSWIAYYLFFYSLKYLLASEIGIFQYIDPVVTILIAMPLLREVPDATFLIGSFLIFFGIYIAEGRIHYHPLHKFFSKKA